MPRLIPSFRPSRPVVKAIAEDKAERDRFYTGRAWRRLRLAFLEAHPLCAECEREGRLTAAMLVHHKKERITHPELALDWDNLESSCNPCHTRRHKKGNADR